VELGLRGRTALVVGASRGLGREIALTLAQEGACVLAVARSETAIHSLVEQMGGDEKGHWGIAADLLPDEAPGELVARITERCPAVDIIVHNLGGTLGIRDPFCALPEWRAMWRLNFEIAVDLNRLLIPPMQLRRWGRVVHISSIAANLSRGSIPYGTVKAALNAYARNLGCTVAPDGVVVSSVMPGAIHDEGGHWDRMLKTQPEMAARYLEQRMAIKRFANPQEIAQFAAFLCSERASFFTGALLPIDGGSY